jgi:hypothetical protein
MRDLIRKIIKNIRSISVSEIWLLPIRNRPFSYYPKVSDPILSEYISEKNLIMYF